MPQSYSPAFAAPAVAMKADASHDALALDYAARLGFNSVDCAVAEKADKCHFELTRREVWHAHEGVRAARCDTARLAPAAFAGASALIANQLVGCASQTSMLQQQQLSNDIANAVAAGQGVVTVQQLTAFQLRSLNIGQNRDAQIAGINSTAASIGAAFAAYGWGGGYGYGGAYGRGYGPGDGAVLPAATAAGGCCGR